jgi:hypothetical protein
MRGKRLDAGQKGTRSPLQRVVSPPGGRSDGEARCEPKGAKRRVGRAASEDEGAPSREQKAKKTWRAPCQRFCAEEWSLGGAPSKSLGVFEAAISRPMQSAAPCISLTERQAH